MSRKKPGRDVRRELSLAGRDLQAGELPRAAARISNVLICAPALPEAHEMLARLVAHPRGGRGLFPLADPLAPGTVVARAHVVAAEGDFGYGLRLLGKAQAYAPETAWADVPWVTDPVTASSVDPSIVANLAVDMVELLHVRGSDGLRPAMSPYLQLVRNTIRNHPNHASLLGAAGYFLRRFDAAEALGYAARADQLAPCHASAIALGLIYRDLGRATEALTALERAVVYDPDDLEVYADICNILLDVDRLDDAQACARRAFAIEPGHICARMAALAVQFRMNRKGADLDALIELCEAQPADSHSRRHGESLLQSTVMKTASRTVVLTGSPKEIVGQIRRFRRNQSD